MNIYRLKYTVLSFKNNPAQFLNGLTSNTMDVPRNAFLNLHGRIIAAFDQIKISNDEEWIVLNSDFVKPVGDHLDRYLKLSGVTMEILDQCVYFDIKGNFSFDEEDVTIPQKSGRLILSRKEFPSTITEKEFLLFRLKHNIPLHGVDYQDDMILNVGYDRVSLTKGCYLGQEFVSKVHNRSKPTWKLIVKAEDECTEEEKAKMTSKVFNSEFAKTMGFVFVKNE